MRQLAFALAFCAACQTATAQTSACRSIADPTARLACYDRSNLPAAAPAAPKPALLPAPKAVESAPSDPLSEEEALVAARMNGICRGC